MRIAEFVQVKGDSVNFIERKYADYSMSQLVELASVPKENRKYFNADMTVEDMRAVKIYMRDSVGFIYMTDSEADRILEKAKKFRAEENAKRAEQKERRREIMRGETEPGESVFESNEQLPGQMNLFDDTFDENETPYYDAAADLEGEKQAIEAAVDEWARSREEAEEGGYQAPRIEIEPCEFITEYPLNVRDGRRAFLADLKKWRVCPECAQAEARYFWRFEDGTEILVEQKKAFDKAIGKENEATVADFYCVRLTAFGEWIATSKIQIERWLGEKYGKEGAREN